MSSKVTQLKSLAAELEAQVQDYETLNPLNPDKKPVVGSPTLGLQHKKSKKLIF